MEYHQITINEYLDIKQKIADKLNSMANDYITIGYYLKRIRDTEAYKQDGYSSLTEFAQKEYGFSEAATSRAIAVNTKFSVDGNTPLLIEDYKGFGSSKLSEMLTLSDEDIKLIKETTTVATIREIKKFNKKAAEYTQSQVESTKTDDVAAVEEPVEAAVEKIEQSKVNTQTCSDLHNVVIEFFRNEKELLDSAWQQKSEQDIVEIINPSGNRTFKKGLYMLIMYDYKEGVALKKFGKMEPMQYTWHDFISTIVDVYKDVYQEGISVHESFYGKIENEHTEVEQSQVKLTKTNILPQKEEKSQENYEDKKVENEKTDDTQRQVESTKTEDFTAAEEEQKESFSDKEKLATSQVNTQLCEDLKEEKVVAEVVSQIKHAKVFRQYGKIVYQENGITIAEEESVDDILNLIEREISEQVAVNNMSCKITFIKE